MDAKSESYISFIGGNLLQPIATLLAEMERQEPKGPNDVQASQRENGFSSAIIVLTVIMLESAINRIQYDPNKTKLKPPLKFIQNQYPNLAFNNELEELFVIRDIIAHNHFWEAQIYWDEDYKMKLGKADLKFGGDKKFMRVLDQITRKTKILGLNVFPNRICRSDVKGVLCVAIEFLKYLDNNDARAIRYSDFFVFYNRIPIHFVDILKSLT